MIFCLSYNNIYFEVLGWFFIGLGGGVLDAVINTILCRIWRSRVELYLQGLVYFVFRFDFSYRWIDLFLCQTVAGVHLALGLGAAVAPLNISLVLQYFGWWSLAIWIICVLLVFNGIVILFIQQPFFETEQRFAHPSLLSLHSI
jgi:MFS family permease